MSRQETTRIFSINTLGAGTQLNGLYEIDEKLSSGGMGEVFRGHEIMSGHSVAIKVVLPELAKDETIVGLFNKEARILRDLNHSAIVRYMAFGTDPIVGRPYLVMEFIDGPSLIDVLDNGPLPLDDAKFLIARLASGLDAAHQLGVIHRDISCDNVILAGGNVRNAKIIDFGIARSSKSVTLLDGKFAGKYNFVSPEQLGLFNSVISEATDIYSLGLVMVNVLRGTPIDMNGTQVEVIEKRRVVPDISDIDPSVRSVIELMLQPDPKDRNVTMSDIVDWFTPETTRNRTIKPVPTTPPREKSAVASTPAPPPPVSGAKPDSPFAATVLADAEKPSVPESKSAPGPGKDADSNSSAPVIAPRAPSAKPDILPLSVPQAPVTPLPLNEPVDSAPAPSAKSKMPLAAAAVLALAVAGAGGWYMMNRGGPQSASTVSAPALQPNQTGGATSTPAGSGDSQASAQKPPEKSAQEILTEKIDWVRSYNGGDCFYARGFADEKGFSIDGIGSDQKIFEKMGTDFSAKFSSQPLVNIKQIVAPQCAVAQFLAKMTGQSATRMNLTLKNAKLKSGDPLSGEITGLKLPNTLLYLIDNDGFVYQIDQFLKRSAEKSTFRIKLVELESRKPLPQMVLVLSSDKPLKGGALSQPAEAGNLMPKLIESINRDKTGMAYGFAFFELGGT